ncbi:MAG TPA: Bax inhibitor-1/YccA family protein [Longimicrobiaceae bacterium]|nr:Bax inhibitor-1/YccA family protein [Longimicrobiaceae bacterium]
MSTRSSNPAFRIFESDRIDELMGQGVMTLNGTILRTGVLLAVTMASAGYVWWQYYAGQQDAVMGAFLVGMIGALVCAIATTLRPRWAPWTAPLYAVLEGVALGGFSAVLSGGKYLDLPILAVGLTFALAAAMLVLYVTGLVRATPRFTKIVVGATSGLLLYMLLAFGLSFVGVRVPGVWDSGPLGIGFCVLVLGVAAANLTLDFALIEEGVSRRAPQYMEWYGAFSLLVTLAWIYIRMLRLLRLVSGRR